MRSFFRLVDSLSDYTGKAACLLVVILTFSICIDALTRSAFAWANYWAYDTTIMLYGAFAILGTAYAHYRHAHVRMDLIYDKLTTRGKAIADVIGYVFLFFPLMSVLVYKCGEHAIWSLTLGERSSASAWRPYMWPFKLVIAYGLALFWLQGLVDFLRRIITAVRGVEYES
jgi:TRAP-type mannitol/chloroaromatic compound transport system permease small subunit